MPFSALVPRLFTTVVVLSAVVLQSHIAADDKQPEPVIEPISVSTKDYVSVRGVYYESLTATEGDNGKQTIPVMMLHGHEGASGEYAQFAKFLQSQGYTVVTIDLRGHGRSTVQKAADGSDEDLELDRFRRTDFEKMLLDVQAAKKFLIGKHNEGKCNVELLTIVGAEMGGIVATNFAVYDWARVNPPSKVYQLGHDVAGLVLLTPLYTFREGGTTITPAFQQPYVATKMPIMVVAGADDRRSFNEAQKVYKAFDKKRGRSTKDPEEIKKRALVMAKVPTTLKGTGLLNPRLPTHKYVAAFLKQYVEPQRSDKMWAKRGP